jgi:hypothetical protein
MAIEVLRTRMVIRELAKLIEPISLVCERDA